MIDAYVVSLVHFLANTTLEFVTSCREGCHEISFQGTWETVGVDFVDTSAQAFIVHS